MRLIARRAARPAARTCTAMASDNALRRTPTAPMAAPAPCPSGLQCNVTCSGGTTTTITGKVYDPAGQEPALQRRRVRPGDAAARRCRRACPRAPTRARAARSSRAAPSSSTTTAVDGTFTLHERAGRAAACRSSSRSASGGGSVTINVTACQDNPQPDKSLAFPSTVAAGDTDDNMPDIAVSTGSADTLECLMRRIGLPDDRVRRGRRRARATCTSSRAASRGGGGGARRGGGPRADPMPGAPASYTEPLGRRRRS